MSKTYKKNLKTNFEEYNDHKVKEQKKREGARKIRRKDEDFLDDESLSSFMNDPKFYRAIKEYY